MSDEPSSEDRQARFKELASGYQAKWPPKVALMLPFKIYIQELRGRKASYDDIRLLLEDVGIVVSLNTVYRFCRNVIGEKAGGPYKTRAPRLPSSKITPVQRPPESIQETLQEHRERYPGPWSRRKPGPRITDSKNL